MVCSESTFIFFKIIYLNYFSNCSEGHPNISIHVINCTLEGVIIIKSLIIYMSVAKRERNTLDSVLSNIEQVVHFLI